MSYALITGASGGLGEEFAKLYAREGYDLILVARSKDKMLALKREIESSCNCFVYIIVQDLSKSQAARNIYEDILRNRFCVNVLVNNAGFGDFGYFWEGDINKQQALLHVNILSLVSLTRLIMPNMIKNHNGIILNVSSVASLLSGPKMALYYASKAFVSSFSEAIADEAQGTGVSVTALLPGPTTTGFEKACDFNNTKMFSLLIPAQAHDVARVGYNAAKKGRKYCYHSPTTISMFLAYRFLPRLLTRKIAKFINGK